MKVTLESTKKIIDINGVPARIWEGQTEGGIPCRAFIAFIAVYKDGIPSFTESPAPIPADSQKTGPESP